MRLACEALRTECGETCAPIGLKPLLKKFDATLTFRSMDVAGKLELTGGRFNVLVNRFGSWRRHRFTIAHEIGHIIILRATARERHLVRALLKPSPELWTALERVCNIAGAEILMPRDEFRSQYDEHSFSAFGLRSLYDRFLTSFAAVLVRIADTATDRTVVVWKRFSRHDNEAIRLRVAACYAGLHGAWLPKGLTSGHFSPDVLDAAQQRVEEVRRHVDLQLSNVLERFETVVVPLKAVRQLSREQLPMFNGHRIPDEPHLSSSLAMLLHGESHRARRATQSLEFDNDPFTHSRPEGA